MDIHEEYHRRQRLKSPLVRYPDHSYLWVRRGGPPRWGAISVQFIQKDEERKPGKMYFSLVVPNRDEYYDRLLSRKLWEKIIEWDEWEPYVQAWAKDNRREYQIVPPAEVPRAAWEVFAFSADSYLAQTLSDRLLDRLHTSLTEQGPEADAAREEVVDHLTRQAGREFAEHMKRFRDVTKPENQAVWLSDLMAA